MTHASGHVVFDMASPPRELSEFCAAQPHRDYYPATGQTLVRMWPRGRVDPEDAGPHSPFMVQRAPGNFGLAWPMIHHEFRFAAGQDVAERFWPNVAIGSEDACWPWQSKSTAKYGYGRMTAGRKRYLRSNQVAWGLKNGPIPDGMKIRHSCDVTSCCNERHLLIGTQADNVADAIKRGRNSPPPILRGEQHHNAKFGLEAARSIARDKRSAAIVAKEYGVSAKTVYRIRRGETWVGQL